MTTINKRPLCLRELFAACISAGWHAGQVIREVVLENHDLGLVNKAEDKYDPQTVADRRSQQRIMYALRKVWPQIRIVGEEGELDEPNMSDIVAIDFSLLDETFPQFSVENERYNPDDLVLWIDPLDGTKRFADKKYDEVSVLLGIAYKRRPIGGVMHLPFHGKHGMTYWGGPHVGLYQIMHTLDVVYGDHIPVKIPENPITIPHNLRVTVSGTNCESVNEALRQLAPSTITLGGATGTMILNVVIGLSDVFFRFRDATKRWDICAVEPLIMALGGRVVDKYGRVYEYDPLGHATAFDNEYGLVVTLNNSVDEHVRQVMSQIEVLRQLDDPTQLMTLDWFHNHVLPTAKCVNQVQVIPGSILRGKQSVVAKLDISYTSQDDTSQLLHVFMKRYVKVELPPRTEKQWKRDMKSYRTEATFYLSIHPLLQNINMIAPIAVHMTHDPNTGEDRGTGYVVFLKNILHQKASIIAEDKLKADDTKHVLLYLTKLHAFTLRSEDIKSRVQAELWSSGTWWSFEKRGHEELQHASRIWCQMLNAWKHVLIEHGVEITSDLCKLGDRMIQQAEYINDQLIGRDSQRYQQWKALVHGDIKTANLFFDAVTRDVTAFDWQWAGMGLGVLDVANLLNTSVSIDALSSDIEHELLQYYYEHFHKAVYPSYDMSDYPFAAFERHYQLATLEYGRVLIANFWEGITPDTCAMRDGNKTNWGLGYRSIPHVVRMIKRLDSGLRMVENERSVV